MDDEGQTQKPRRSHQKLLNPKQVQKPKPPRRSLKIIRTQAFDSYLRLRSSNQVAVELGIHPTTAATWCKEDQWVSRALEWDREERLRVAEQAHRSMVEERRRLLESLGQINSVARVWVQHCMAQIKRETEAIQAAQGDAEALAKLPRMRPTDLKQLMQTLLESQRAMGGVDDKLTDEARVEQEETVVPAAPVSLDALFSGWSSEELETYCRTGQLPPDKMPFGGGGGNA